MISLKKLFFTIFIALTGFVLMSSEIKINAINASTAWNITFDKKKTINVNSSTMGTRVEANEFSISYDDKTGRTESGKFEIYEAFSGGHENYKLIVSERTIQKGQTMTFNYGGFLYLKAYHYDYGKPVIDADLFPFYLERSIINTDRIETNFYENQYIYDQDVFFMDGDNYKYIDDPALTIQIYSIEKEDYLHFEPYTKYFWAEKNGEYVAIIKRKLERKEYRFAINRQAPTIQLYEVKWMDETPVESNFFTSGGIKAVYSSSSQIKTMKYSYTTYTGKTELGEVDNNYTFWRKGGYSVTVIDVHGNSTSVAFRITDYDLVVDPEGARVVGTEVTVNHGAYGDPTLHVGFNRCIYIGPNGPSQSRFDFYFTSSDEHVATISEYGTITAHRPGEAIITSFSKETGLVGIIEIIVLA